MSRRCLAVVLLAAAAAAHADDLSPPPWRLGPGTTVQHWDFSSGPTGFAPDAGPLHNPYGPPVMSPAVGTNWLPAAFGRNDVWQIANGSLSFLVPNTGNQNNQKELWLQVTYFGNSPAGGPNYSVAGPGGPFTQLGSQTTALPGGWTHELTRWNIGTCPPFERVAILPNFAGVQVLIDQVVIDTICQVPTPGALALLGLAGIAAVRRRRGR